MEHDADCRRASDTDGRLFVEATPGALATKDLFLLYMSHPFEADGFVQARVDHVLPSVAPERARTIRRLFTAVRICNAIRTGGLSLILRSDRPQTDPESRLAPS